MFETFLVLMSLAAAAGCFWVYWSMQKAEKRISESEETVRAKAILVGELADEIVMASQYLYEAMDSCLARIESVDPQLETLTLSPETQAESVDRQLTSLTLPPETEVESINPQFQTLTLPPEPEAESYSASELVAAPPFTTELNLAAESESESISAFDIPAESVGGRETLKLDVPGADAIDLVERARRMGMGVEELRLQLRFQENQVGAD